MGLEKTLKKKQQARRLQRAVERNACCRTCQHWGHYADIAGLDQRDCQAIRPESFHSLAHLSLALQARDSHLRTHAEFGCALHEPRKNGG